jgi:hypothetical protein
MFAWLARLASVAPVVGTLGVRRQGRGLGHAGRQIVLDRPPFSRPRQRERPCESGLVYICRASQA